MAAEQPDMGHTWVVATTVAMSEHLARQANRRGTVRIPRDTKVEVQGVYCGGCRRPFDRVAHEPCVAVESNAHLIGGPTGKRRGRSDDLDAATG